MTSVYKEFLADPAAGLPPEVGGLFDTADPASRPFPGPYLLEQVLDQRNNLELVPVVGGDEGPREEYAPLQVSPFDLSFLPAPFNPVRIGYPASPQIAARSGGG